MKSRVKHSIFLKLQLVIVLTGILITALVLIFFQIHFSSRIKSQFNKNTSNYFSYIAKEIGSPPDTALARKLSDKYSIEIIYQSKSVNWSSEISSKTGKGFFKFFITTFIDNNEYIISNSDGSRFIFNSDFHRSFKPQPFEFALLIFTLINILVLSYFLIRKILKPIKYLSKGVYELSTGNFAHKIPVTSTDELSSLSNSFNEMTKRIKEMIHSRDQLLIDVSHELRTPITRIKLSLEMMEDGKDKYSIASDIKEIEVMITEILESERLKIGLKIENSNVIYLIKETAYQFEDTYPRVILNKLPDEIYLKFDYERMRIVLKNIIENALKYSHQQSRPVEISVEENGDKVFIKIKDDGIGIPVEDIPYIFEPFFRADKSRSKRTAGFGLGLSISKQIIDAHNGKIEIINNVDSGITLIIELNKVQHKKLSV